MFPFLCSGGGAPPVSIVNLTTGTDAVGGASFTTASITLTANKLGLLAVASRMNSSVTPNTPTITGWTLIDAIEYDTGAPSQKKISLFRRLAGTDSTGTLAIEFAGQSQTHCVWVVDEASDNDTGGTNGSTATVQSATAKDEVQASLTLTVTLAAFSSSNNATYGAFSSDTSSSAPTVGAGFTSLGDANINTVIRLGTEFKDTNDTSVDYTWATNTSAKVGGIAIEIKRA
jgi:hypothetical protein